MERKTFSLSAARLNQRNISMWETIEVDFAAVTAPKRIYTVCDHCCYYPLLHE